jgi:hypothetical protein
MSGVDGKFLMAQTPEFDKEIEILIMTGVGR